MRSEMTILYLLVSIFASICISSASFQNNIFSENNIEEDSHSLKIAGGRSASRGQFPFLVSVQFRNGGVHLAGGTLIAPEWVLTSAHNIYDLFPRELQVMTGDYNRNIREGSEQTIRAAEIIVHSNFIINRVPPQNNIALIRLERPARLDAYTRPVRMAYNCNHLSATDKCSVMGWGISTTSATNSAVVQFVDIPLLGNRVCADNYRSSYLRGDSVICAGSVSGGSGFCSGDNGGPLVCVAKDGTYEVVAVASWRIGCAEKNRPGVYSSVSHYYDWIFDKITDGFGKPFKYRCTKKNDASDDERMFLK